MEPDTDSSASAGHVLVVCTGNVCRSPYIERVLAAQLAGTGITVSSAGTQALVGSPVDPGTASRISQVGANADGFTPRQLDRQLVVSADLVISATREHLSSVVQLHPRALRYSFALRDLSDLLDDVPEADVVAAAGENRVAKVAAAAIAGRGRVNPRLPAESGVIDPFGRDARVFDQMAEEITRSLPPIVSALRGP